MDGVLPYTDDIFIHGKNVKDHNLTVKQVLEHLQISGIYLQRENHKFVLPKIELLGFCVIQKDIKLSFDKMKAIHEAPSPKDKLNCKSL